MIYSGRCILLAFSIMAVVAAMCSITPFMPVKKPFCAVVSMMEFFVRKASRREARILWKILPMVEVRAMGRKLLVSKLGPSLSVRTMLPMHQDGGAALLSNRTFEYSEARNR